MSCLDIAALNRSDRLRSAYWRKCKLEPWSKHFEQQTKAKIFHRIIDRFEQNNFICKRNGAKLRAAKFHGARLSTTRELSSRQTGPWDEFLYSHHFVDFNF